MAAIFGCVIGLIEIGAIIWSVWYWHSGTLNRRDRDFIKSVKSNIGIKNPLWSYHPLDPVPDFDNLSRAQIKILKRHVKAFPFGWSPMWNPRPRPMDENGPRTRP